MKDEYWFYDAAKMNAKHLILSLNKSFNAFVIYKLKFDGNVSWLSAGYYGQKCLEQKKTKMYKKDVEKLLSVAYLNDTWHMNPFATDAQYFLIIWSKTEPDRTGIKFC